MMYSHFLLIKSFGVVIDKSDLLKHFVNAFEFIRWLRKGAADQMHIRVN